MSVVEGIKIESDEDGFHLILTGDFVDLAEKYLADPDATSLDFRIQGVAWEFVDEMKQINEWRHEGEIAKAQYDGFVLAGLKFENGEWVVDDESL